MNEGIIKFKCNWIKAGPIDSNLISELNVWRDSLFELGLIGVYPEGIGFGNISRRFDKNSFIITGSATGNLNKLTENHYTHVTTYNLLNNSLTCSGPIMASSESLSHAAIYECSPEINAVIHVHNNFLWEHLKNKVPTTSDEITYGTPEMAFEIKRLFKESPVLFEKMIIMGGHKEGIITFGETLEEAGRILLEKL
jgi:ribulose-5-phosphate 4-epimerase/fuculose-1-phosphate aldolase